MTSEPEQPKAPEQPLETAPWSVQTPTFGGIGLGMLTALLILLG